MTAKTLTAPGAVIDVPLNRLKASPRNARRTPHGAAAIEALAASIAAKGVLQAPVVEPETGPDGTPTGAYLVTIGEGRRQALRLLAKRRAIDKAALVRCVVDEAHDAHEISLDENVTRSDMHPADQFEAFQRLAGETGWGAEEIAARFGVSAQVVRQRLRLAAVSPRLMAVYREGGLTLDQLMAFAVSEDHARQEQVHDQLGWNRSAQAIRRAMTEAKVAALDRRAVFVGLEAYAEAGGGLLRDLFTEDGGGWLEDVALLDRLVLDKLQALACEVQAAEGWAWGEAGLDYPHGLGLARVWPRPVERSDEETAKMAALADEYDALVSQWDGAEDWPAEVSARLDAIEAALRAFGEDHAYDPADIARGGIVVVLGHDGRARIERGLIRPEDVAAEPEPPAATDGDAAPGASDGEAEDGPAPLAERLVLDLTAHRTMGLREALGAQPALALCALVHALAVRTFYPPYEPASCVEVKLVCASLEGHAPGVGEGPAGRRVAERHAAWAARMPQRAADAWAFVRDLGGEELMALMAHCTSLGVNAVQNSLDRRETAWDHAGRLAEAAGLDMAATWTATRASYLGRVAKARILEAVSEACGAEAAQRIAGLKKAEMAEAAEALIAGTGWLPDLLRTTQGRRSVDPVEAAQAA